MKPCQNGLVSLFYFRQREKYGLVPFSMEKIRPCWSPPIPGISWFLETNLRTYVVDSKGREGVWFFSLDANSRLAVGVARKVWHLPYWHSDLSLTVTDHGSEGKVIEYAGTRRSDRRVAYQAQVRLPSPQHAAPAGPGTLEHFLVERYRLFAVDRREVLRTGIVHHAPYQLSPVHDGVISETFSSAPGLFESLSAVPDHWAFSWGVDVRVSPLSVVAANTE